jgi:hypothetical protein
MKTTFYSLALAAVTCGFAVAQTTAFTTPVGYSTQQLGQGFNLVGLTLQTPTIAAGKFETITATTAVDNDVIYAPVAGKTYVLEITSGTLIGGIFEVPAANISGGTLTITTVPASNLVTLGLTTSDTYKLRLAPSLVDVFTLNPLASGGVLAAAVNVANSDVVWVPTAVAGVYDRYILRLVSGVPGFQRVTGTTTSVAVDGNLIRLIYADGVLIQKRTAATASLTVSGEVKLVGTDSVLGQGFNLISSVAPVGLTLRTANFITTPPTLASAVNVANSDIIWVQRSNLSYDRYYFHSTTSRWRDAGTNTELPLATDPVLGSAFYIQKRTATPLAPLNLAVPASYSGL